MQNETLMKEFGSALFAFVIIATLAIGIPLIFFVDIDTTARISEAIYIANEQDILLYNISYDFNRTTEMFSNLILLDDIILYEQWQVLNISNWVDALDCVGVKSINGNTASPNPERNFTFDGDGGINIETNAFNTIYVNGTALKTQYDGEIQSISTLFDMTLATQLAISVLDAEVVKSINFVTPNANTSSITVYGECATQVYTLYNGTIAIDMCGISNNLTAAFDGIQYEFDSVNILITELLLETTIVVNQSQNVYNNAISLNSSAIYTINGVLSIFNNINLIASTGISIVNGSLPEEIVIGNAGLIGINGLTATQNNNIVAGPGITIIPGTNKITIRNDYYVEPCRVTVTTLAAFPAVIVSTGPSWTSFIQNWGPQTEEPSSCYGGTIFQPTSYLGFPYGIFYMPEGLWTLSVDIMLMWEAAQSFGFDPPKNVQFIISLDGVSYDIPFGFISFIQRGQILSYYYGYYHFELTLSSLIIPAGTGFVVRYQMFDGIPSQSFVYFAEYSMIRIG